MTFDALAKPSQGVSNAASRSHEGPVRRGFAYSLSALDGSKINDCEKLMELDHPYPMRLDQIMEENDGGFFTVRERQHIRLKDYFWVHHKDFFYIIGPKSFVRRSITP